MPFAARLFGILMVVAGALVSGQIVYAAEPRPEGIAQWFLLVALALTVVGFPALGGASYLLFTKVRTDPEGLVIVGWLSKEKASGARSPRSASTG